MTKETHRTTPLTGLSLLSAALIVAAILFGTGYAAERVRASDFYRSSRLIGMIVSQEGVGLADMAGNKRNVDMMLKFVGALTSAYIDFELIPVGEVSTFTAVFESVPEGVEIEKFEYHRKDLFITGKAESGEAYKDFLTALRETDYFAGVNGHFYLSTDDDIRFELECTSHAVSVSLIF